MADFPLSQYCKLASELWCATEWASNPWKTCATYPQVRHWLARPPKHQLAPSTDYQLMQFHRTNTWLHFPPTFSAFTDQQISPCKKFYHWLSLSSSMYAERRIKKNFLTTSEWQIYSYQKIKHTIKSITSEGNWWNCSSDPLCAMQNSKNTFQRSTTAPTTKHARLFICYT